MMEIVLKNISKLNYMTQQQFQAAFEAEVQESMKENRFPKHLIPENFDQWFQKAIKFESPISLGCKPDLFKEILLTPTEEKSLYHFAWAINAMERRTILEMDMSEEEYITMLDAVSMMNEQANNIVSPIRTAIQRKLEVRNRLELNNTNGHLKHN